MYLEHVARDRIMIIDRSRFASFKIQWRTCLGGAAICKTILLIYHDGGARDAAAVVVARLTEQCFPPAKRMGLDRAKWTGERRTRASVNAERERGEQKNDNRELCGTLRRNVKATRRPERKSFLVIHPSARGPPGEKRPVNCGSAIPAKATMPRV